MNFSLDNEIQQRVTAVNSNVYILSFLSLIDGMDDPCETFRKLFEDPQFKLLSKNISKYIGNNKKSSKEVIKKYIKGSAMKFVDDKLKNILEEIFQNKNLNKVFKSKKSQLDKVKMYVGKVIIMSMKKSPQIFEQMDADTQKMYIKSFVQLVPMLIGEKNIAKIESGKDIVNYLVDRVVEDSILTMSNWINFEPKDAYKYYIDFIKELNNTLTYESKVLSSKKRKRDDTYQDKDNKRPRH